MFHLGPLEHARKYFLPYTDTFPAGLVALGRGRDHPVRRTIVTFGHLLREPLHQFHTQVVPRLGLLLFLLLMPRSSDRFSLGHALARWPRSGSRRAD